MEILGLIPARGGSKGIPGKNIRLLAGKPLITHTIHTALKSELIDRVMVSTDSEEIANISKKAGAEVPFLRPNNLAEDDTPMLSVIKHCLEQITAMNWHPDILILLQATSPFRKTQHLDNAIEKFLESSVTCLISVRRVNDNPYWMKVIKGKFISPFIENTHNFHLRQSLPIIYIPNGAIYIWKTSYILNSNQLLPSDTIAYEMDDYSSLDLDNEMDWKFAEFLIKENLNKMLE